jgi:3-oxoacyl-(acyl-carrier-protein) synthase
MMNMPFEELRQLHQQAGVDGHADTTRLLHADVANDPMVFYRSQSCTAIGLLTQLYGIRGLATSMHTACASGGQAVGAGMKLIGNGTCDYVLAGGFDSMISPVGIAGFSLLNAISTDNEQPHRASRPFDATRNGFVLGEGAGFVVLEEWNAAQDRGAHIYAELAGEGNSLSSYRVTDSHPSGDGPIQAMQEALRCADARPEDIDYINAHGTSTLMNDRCEAAAIRQVFGEHAPRVAVSSTKSMMGHLIAAAGAVEAVICALAIDRSSVPASANLQERDPECDLNFVLEKHRELPVRMAMSNSFGFGGTNNCLVLRNAREQP